MWLVLLNKKLSDKARALKSIEQLGQNINIHLRLAETKPEIEGNIFLKLCEKLLGCNNIDDHSLWHQACPGAEVS